MRRSCLLFVLVGILISFLAGKIYSLPADHILEDDIIYAGSANDMPILGEVNAGVGATIHVEETLQQSEEKKPELTLDDFKKQSVSPFYQSYKST